MSFAIFMKYSKCTVEPGGTTKLLGGTYLEHDAIFVTDDVIISDQP